MGRPIITGNEITIPSDTEHLADVDMFIEGILRGWGVDESVIADIAISVSELVNNAINHGNKYSADKKVAVEIGKEDSSVKITVTDQGTGFNPKEIANPIDDDNLLKEIGRGLFIVKSLMDSLEFHPSEKGSKVTIKKVC